MFAFAIAFPLQVLDARKLRRYRCLQPEAAFVLPSETKIKQRKLPFTKCCSEDLFRRFANTMFVSINDLMLLSGLVDWYKRFG
jgi:hypothetical protein